MMYGLAFHERLQSLAQYGISGLDLQNTGTVSLSISFVGASIVAFGWLMLCLVLARKHQWLSMNRTIWLALPAVVAGILILWRPMEGYIYARFEGGFVHSFGIYFWIQTGVCLIYIFSAAAILVVSLFSTFRQTFRKSVIFILIGFFGLVIIAAVAIYIRLVYGADSSALKMLASLILILIALYCIMVIQQFHIFGIITIAQNDMIRHMSEGLIVLDRKDILIDCNDAAKELIHVNKGERFTLESFAGGEGRIDSEMIRRFLLKPEEAFQTEIRMPGPPLRYFNMYVNPIAHKRKGMLGRIIQLSEVTKLKMLIEESNRKNQALYDRNQDLLKIQEELSTANRKLEQLATIDSLTGCYNRRYLFQYVEHDLIEKQRYGIPFAIILFDLDDFKCINDTYGHPVGDEVLKKVARMIQSGLRKSDMIARYGGEEFTIYLPHATNVQAVSLAERLREMVERQVILVGDIQVKVTISMGLASWEGTASNKTVSDSGQLLASLMHKADSALYKAKAMGKNNLVLAEPL